MGSMITPGKKRLCMVMWAPSCEETIYFSLHPLPKAVKSSCHHMPVCLCMSRERERDTARLATVQIRSSKSHFDTAAARAAIRNHL